MRVSVIIAAFAEQRARSAWERGVLAYAESMLEDLGPGDELHPPHCGEDLFNDASTWHDYSWGGCLLIYDTDIDERLCGSLEIRRSDSGCRHLKARENGSTRRPARASKPLGA